MFSSTRLCKNFWVEALNMTCYLVNKSPSYALEGDVLQYIWSGRKVNYYHLKVFGCNTLCMYPRRKGLTMVSE